MSALERIADRAGVRAADRVADTVRAAMPGARVAREGERITIEGRGLRRDSRLRWIAGLLR